MEIKDLLEKFWLAETTLEEEARLAEYFHSGEVAPELEQYRAFFDYVEEEKAVKPSVDLEARILEKIDFHAAPVRPLWKMGYSVAAAVMVAVVSVFLVVRMGGEPKRERVKEVVKVKEIKDTYDDPEKALAAVKRALLVASVHMNEGKKIVVSN